MISRRLRAGASVRRVVFAGTPDFARVALEALLKAGFEVPLVLTQPDRPAGRGMKLQASAVKQAAVSAGIEVCQPRSLRQDGKFAEDAQFAQQKLLEAQADVMVVAAYGLILPLWVLDLPDQGCINIHASLLPRWRGAAPIHRAIEAGDVASGITLMQMDEGLDTGDMLMSQSVAIQGNDTTASLHDRLATLGGNLVVSCLQSQSSLLPQLQPPEGVTYAHKIEKHEAGIDWSLAAAVIERRIRAFDPFPGCTLSLDGEVLKVWQAEVIDQTGAPGEVLAVHPDALVIGCGEQALSLKTVQRPGGKRIAIQDYLRAHPVKVGDQVD